MTKHWIMGIASLTSVVVTTGRADASCPVALEGEAEVVRQVRGELGLVADDGAACVPLWVECRRVEDRVELELRDDLGRAAVRSFDTADEAAAFIFEWSHRPAPARVVAVKPAPGTPVPAAAAPAPVVVAPTVVAAPAPSAPVCVAPPPLPVCVAPAPVPVCAAPVVVAPAPVVVAPAPVVVAPAPPVAALAVVSPAPPRDQRWRGEMALDVVSASDSGGTWGVASAFMMRRMGSLRYGGGFRGLRNQEAKISTIEGGVAVGITTPLTERISIGSELLLAATMGHWNHGDTYGTMDWGAEGLHGGVGATLDVKLTPSFGLAVGVGVDLVRPYDTSQGYGFDGYYYDDSTYRQYTRLDAGLRWTL